jgi:hypothetical protein
VICVAAASCGGGNAAPDAPRADAESLDAPPAVDDPTSPDVPPRGQALLTPWLAAGYYKSWPCEPMPHPEAYPSNHGYNRTCNNPILHGAPPGIGNYPLDSASVKELYLSDLVTLRGYAVSRKINDNLGDGWYWYEIDTGVVSADGMATEMVNGCVGCHQCAPRDFVYAVAP